MITIDYILAERSREYFGEGYRWFDLVRTQKWGELAKSYTIGGVALTDHTAKVYNRTISNYMYLRPIPQGQMESMELSAGELAAYQNPGY
ncbi:SusD family protein [compost metagenome]